MHFSILFASAWLAICSTIVSAFPDVPFTTSGRWIRDSNGKNFTYVGVNWPGAADTMLPEGLQYQSISFIVSKIKSLNLNVIRLTFAIEMIDDILDKGGDVPILTAFTKALGSSNGQKVFNAVVKNNPQFSASTTRLQVFDAVAAECAKQGIYVHLDNHMSQAAWCCSTTDGNSWFGDKYFDVTKWKRGLEYIAKHGASWPALISIGMRNELRSPDDKPSPAPQAYNWGVWHTNMVAAANMINAANPNILIFYSGLNFDTTLEPIVSGSDLGNGVRFQKSSFAYSNKIVLEIHNYQNSATSCDSMKSGLQNNAFKALTASGNSAMPVVLTEFGFNQGDNSYSGVYASCLRTYIPSLKAGWTVWVLSGSYYIRSGTQDYEETWGLLKHDWSDWRSNTAIQQNLVPMIKASLA